MHPIVEHCHCSGAKPYENDQLLFLVWIFDDVWLSRNYEGFEVSEVLGESSMETVESCWEHLPIGNAIALCTAVKISSSEFLQNWHTPFTPTTHWHNTVNTWPGTLILRPPVRFILESPVSKKSNGEIGISQHICTVMQVGISHFYLSGDPVDHLTSPHHLTHSNNPRE